ncbi:MAG: hypothetical protein ACI9YL_001336 [Luteibaculaceae bacterium]|jgi:uncharacterized protein (TIGR01777 family)
MEKKTVIITGITGFVGSALCLHLKKEGYSVIGLGRKETLHLGVPVFSYQQLRSPEFLKWFKGCTSIVHLSGAGIGDEKWSLKRIKVLTDSRVDPLVQLKELAMEIKHTAFSIISASGVGYYDGNMGVQNESSPSGTGVLVDICVAWEKAALSFQEIGVPVHIIRTSVVLGKGGILSKLDKMARWGILSPLGSGQQPFPWVALDDLVYMYAATIKKGKDPIINAVSPSQDTNKTFTKAFLQKYGKRMWFPKVPAWVLKLRFGQMSTLLLQGTAVKSNCLDDFPFENTTLASYFVNTKNSDWPF